MTKNPFSVSIDKEKSAVRMAESRPFTVPLKEFYSAVINHKSSYCINGESYNILIPTINSLYFFNDATQKEFTILFEPIVDIKYKSHTYIIFYYSTDITTLILQ